MIVRAATRGSPLALWQTREVARILRRDHPEIEIVEVVVSTIGDREINRPIGMMGGKGVFSKEVQLAVLDGRADIAVHSGKDLPSITPPGLVIAAVPERADPRDVLVGRRLGDLEEGAVVGTGSARRKAQLADLRPDLEFRELRGNIATRLSKAGDFDAIVMAKAALDRLGLTPAVVDPLPVDEVVPQVAQGALVVECREEDHPLRRVLRVIEDPVSRQAVDAERAFLVELGGDCELPAGAHAIVTEGVVRIRGALAAGWPGTVARLTLTGAAPAIGAELARRLRSGV